MDGGGSSGGGNQGDGGDASMPWGSLGGDAPLPPVFGNANAQAAGGDMDFKVGRAAPPILICRLDTRYTRTQEMDQCDQSCTFVIGVFLQISCGWYMGAVPVAWVLACSLFFV